MDRVNFQKPMAIIIFNMEAIDLLLNQEKNPDCPPNEFYTNWPSCFYHGGFEGGKIRDSVTEGFYFLHGA